MYHYQQSALFFFILFHIFCNPFDISCPLVLLGSYFNFRICLMYRGCLQVGVVSTRRVPNGTSKGITNLMIFSVFDKLAYNYNGYSVLLVVYWINHFPQGEMGVEGRRLTVGNVKFDYMLSRTVILLRTHIQI